VLDGTSEMNAIVMIDSLCSRYHCLPSEALARGNTLDLYFLTNAVGFHNRKQTNQTNNLGAVPNSDGDNPDLAALYALSKKGK